MNINKRLGTSSFLLFSAICGMAGTSVASAAAESDVQKDVTRVRNVQNKQKNVEEQSDIIDDEDDVPVDYSDLENLLEETDEVSWSLTKILAVAVPPIMLVGGATYLYLNPDSRKKLVEAVFGSGKIFGSKEILQEKTADLEKLFDEWYAKRKAAEEKAERDKAEKTEKVKEEPSEKAKAWKRLKARASKGIAFILTPRTKVANWVFGVLDRALPKAVSQKLKDWFYLDNANENGRVFNALYALALVYGALNIIRLIYTNPDVLSLKYFVAPFHAKEGTEDRKRLQRGKIVLLKTLDATLKLLVPPYAFARAGLEFAGDMYYLVDPAEKLKDLFGKIKSMLNYCVEKLNISRILQDKINTALEEKKFVTQEQFNQLRYKVNGLVRTANQEIEKINKKFESSSKKNNRLNKKIIDINDKLDKIRQEIKNFVNKEEIVEINGRIEVIEGQKLGENIDNVNQKINYLENQLNDAVKKGDFENINNQIEGLINKVKRVEDSFNNVVKKGELDEINKRIGELENLKNQIDGIKGELDKKIDIRDKKIGEDIEKIKKDIFATQSKMASKDKEINSLAEGINNIEAKMKEIKGVESLKEINIKFNNIKKDMSHLVNNIASAINNKKTAIWPGSSDSKPVDSKQLLKDCGSFFN